MNTWTARRKARRLKNLQIVEVSSVDRGASGDHDGVGRATVQLMKRDKMRQSHEPFALEAHGLEKARRVLAAMDLDRANKAHSDGTLSSVEYSDVLMGLARAQYPDDKDALAKFLKLHEREMSQKLADDYAASQLSSALGTAGWGDHAAAMQEQNEFGARNGIGIRGTPTTPVNNGTGGHTDTAANYDGAQSRISRSDVYARVHKTLMGEGMSSDAAWTAIHRLERKESIGW
jgi:hypothetical protein